MKFGMNIVSKKLFDPYSFSLAMGDIEEVKTILKVGDAKYILLNISEITEDTVSM